MEKSKRKLAPIDRIFRTVLFAAMLFFILTYIFMYLWLLLNSFRTSGAFTKNSFGIFNFSEFTIENYKTLFETQVAGSRRHPVFLMDTIINTLVLVVGQVLLAITIPAFTAYIIAKYDFKLKAIILNVAIVTMIIPTVGTLATTYKLINDMGLLNKYACIFLMSSGGFGFGFLLFRSFFASIPWSYAESAFLDGASDMQVFLRIMYPQAVPIVVAIAITAFIGSWNDYFTAYIYLPDKPTISLGVYQLYSRMEKKLLWPVGFAGMTLLATVSLIVFACFNKMIMNNMSAGGIKG